MHKPYPETIQEKVVKLYKRGYSLEKISDMRGMPSSPKTVARILKKHGVKRRNPGIFDHKQIRDDLIKHPNYTLTELATLHDCSVRLVSQVRRDLKDERAREAKLRRELKERRALEAEAKRANPPEDL